MNNAQEHWLAILPTASASLAVLYRWDGFCADVLEQMEVCQEGDYSEKLIPAIESLLDKVSLRAQDLKKLLTVSGPGSYTGLRIIYSSLKAMSLVLKIPMETVDASEIRLLGWVHDRPRNPTTTICVGSYLSKNHRIFSSYESVPENNTWKLTSHCQALKWPKDCSEWTCLGDEKTEAPDAISFHRYSLNAKDVGKFITLARSRRTTSDIKDWIELAPIYH